MYTPLTNKSLDLSKSWQQFKEANSSRELKDWQRKVYVPGQHQSIDNKLSEHGERILKEKEEEL